MTNPVPVREPPPAPGEWTKPMVSEHRSPCPALNSLANSGYLPRSGRVTSEQLVRALYERLGLPRYLGALITRRAMGRLGKASPDGAEKLDLASLGEHGFLEHDASLTRRDARLGDAVEVAPLLVDQLLSFSEDGRTLTLEDLAVAHQVRMAQAAAGGHEVPFKAAVLGTLEAALLYEVLHRDDSIALGDLREFLVKERIPASVLPRKLGLSSILLTTFVLAVTGNIPLFRAARRAREAARESILAARPGCPFALRTLKQRSSPVGTGALYPQNKRS